MVALIIFLKSEINRNIERISRKDERLYRNGKRIIDRLEMEKYKQEVEPQ